MNNGPAMTDKEFFSECLDWEYPGLEAVRACAEKEAFVEARHLFAEHVRENLRADIYFQIPYREAMVSKIFPEENDEEICRRICDDNTFVALNVPYMFPANEPINWEANPTAGPGFSQEWPFQINRHWELKILAKEYRRTGEEKLAQKAKELFVSWVKQQPYPGLCMPLDTICWRQLEAGMRMAQSWPDVVHTFYKCEAFTDDVLVDWYKSICEHGERLMQPSIRGNILHNLVNGLGHMGILYPQLKKSKEWLARAISLFEKIMETEFYADGFGIELTAGYHNVSVMNFIYLVECAQAYGVELPPKAMDKLELAVELFTKIMMPNGYWPNLNDSKWWNISKTCKKYLRVFPENRWLRWACLGLEADKPDCTSIALPWAGQVIMRTGWETTDSWIHLDAGPFGASHQHEDKLSVMFFAGGKIILTDSGNYVYDASDMRQYVRSTRAHNTVRVNGLEQNRRIKYASWKDWKEEYLYQKADMKWKFGEEWDYAQGQYDEGYGPEAENHVVHHRKVFFCKKPRAGVPYLIVVDRMYGDENDSYEWFWHVRSDEEKILPGKISFADVDICHSYGEADVITGQHEPEIQGFAADYDGRPYHMLEVPCIVNKAAGKEVRMVTVFYPRNEGVCRIEAVEASINVKETKLTIHFADGSVLVLDEDALIGD